MSNFKDFRDFFSIVCTKVELLVLDSRYLIMNSLEGVVINIAGGIIPVRHDIEWNFKREYFLF